MRRIPSFFLLLVLIVSVQPIQAQDASLAAGIRAYTAAEYRTAIAVLEALDESTLRLDERVVRHKYLALSLIGRKERERAQEEFIKLLVLDPAYELSEKEAAPSVLEQFQRSKVTQGARLCDQGIEAYAAGRFTEAIPLLEQAVRLNPRDPRAGEFLKLAGNRLREEEVAKKEPCRPVRTWGELDAKRATCQGVNYSSSFQLPARANRVTLIYSKHAFGVGACWKIVLYDSEGKEVLVLDDPDQAFAKKEEPGLADRWRVVDLPEAVTIGRVVMYGERGPALRFGKDQADELILGLEVTCPPDTPRPVE
jgi:tetratricopeptide (TPR) repeat protein